MHVFVFLEELDMVKARSRSSDGSGGDPGINCGRDEVSENS